MNIAKDHFGGLLIAVALLTGCGDGAAKLDLPPLHPVSGTVTYQGRPTAGIRVIFNPLASTGKLNFAPQAITDENGVYQLQTTKPGDGAPIGEFAVTFQWPDHINVNDGTDERPEVDKLRGTYADPAKSTHRFAVQAGNNTVPPFDLR